MASYAPRPDGLLEVTLDDGRRMPTALDASMLEAQGIYATPPMPEPPPVAPDMRTAGLGNMSQMPEAGMSQAPIGPPLPPAPPADQPMARPSPVTSTAASPTAFVSEQFGAPAPPQQKRDLVPITPGAQPQGAAGLSDADIATRAFLAGELAPRGGPVKRTEAHDERAAFAIKYKQPDEDPALSAAIAEGQDDIYASREEYAKKQQADLGMSARLASRDAVEAQDQLEKTLIRKSNIERDVGAKIQAIEDRFAKARAVTESGSARDRVMKDKGWFGRILATIGVAMGAFAAGQTGGRNLVQEQLNKEVDEELEREKQLYNVEPETSALRAYVDAWGTPQGAEKEYSLQLKNAALTRLDAWARRAGAENVPIEFANWMADEKQKLLLDKQKLHNEAAAEVTESWRHVPEKVTGGYSRPDPLKVMKRGAEFRKAYLEATGQDPGNLKPRDLEAVYNRSLRLPDGSMAFAPDQKRAQETEAQLGAIGIIRQNLAEIRAIMKKPASEINLADRERLRVLVQSNTTVGKEAEKLGALSGPDMALIAPLSGEQALRRLNPMNPDVAIVAGLEAAENHFNRKATAAMRGIYRDPNMKTPYSAPKPASFQERP